jgi:hypothetical protein
VPVRRPLDLKFVGIDGQWTRDIDEAMDFGEEVEAMEWVTRQGLDRVRVMVGGCSKAVACEG